MVSFVFYNVEVAIIKQHQQWVNGELVSTLTAEAYTSMYTSR